MLVIVAYLILPKAQQSCLPMTKQAFGVDHACDRGVAKTTTTQKSFPHSTKRVFRVDHAFDRGVPNTIDNSAIIPPYN
ncbi:hypothetical protein TIFTF001_027308 [Ficus carica]|uniref:Uncharacterized protein n=1 Tax=Ficus carica TaxID=3494 RepID=A0AA88IY96_FICCA|nr:hypothetical protein TIFTF001_027308 [Ficus carica]